MPIMSFRGFHLSDLSAHILIEVLTTEPKVRAAETRAAYWNEQHRWRNTPQKRSFKWLEIGIFFAMLI